MNQTVENYLLAAEQDTCGAIDLRIRKESKEEITSGIPLTIQHGYFSESSNGSSDVLQPQAKRRRLSEQSSVTNESTWTAPFNPMMSPASFIQQTFAPQDGQGTLDPMMVINNSALSRVMQYNANMVRKFPKKERSEKDQERRDKNTLACRISRCKEKFKNIAIEAQYKAYVQQTFDMNKQIMYEAAYLNELLRLDAKLRPDKRNAKVVDFCAKKLNLKNVEMLATTAQEPPQEPKAGTKRSFSISFLLGIE